MPRRAEPLLRSSSLSPPARRKAAGKFQVALPLAACPAAGAQARNVERWSPRLCSKPGGCVRGRRGGGRGRDARRRATAVLGFPPDVRVPGGNFFSPSRPSFAGVRRPPTRRRGARWVLDGSISRLHGANGAGGGGRRAGGKQVMKTKKRARGGLAIFFHALETVAGLFVAVERDLGRVHAQALVRACACAPGAATPQVSERRRRRRPAGADTWHGWLVLRPAVGFCALGVGRRPRDAAGPRWARTAYALRSRRGRWRGGWRAVGKFRGAKREREREGTRNYIRWALEARCRSASYVVARPHARPCSSVRACVRARRARRGERAGARRRRRRREMARESRGGRRRTSST